MKLVYKFCKFLALGAMAMVIAAMVIEESAWSQPADGFSIMISAVEHDNTIKFDKGLLDGFELDYTSSGQGLGIDYQIELGDASSLVLFYQNSSESVDDDLNAFDRWHFERFAVEPPPLYREKLEANEAEKSE